MANNKEASETYNYFSDTKFVYSSLLYSLEAIGLWGISSSVIEKDFESLFASGILYFVGRVGNNILLTNRVKKGLESSIEEFQKEEK